jgi:hypothetical protein
MTEDAIRPRDTVRLVYRLTTPEMRRHEVYEIELPPSLALLRKFQSDRLARTYADLLASPRYGMATGFFLSDMYAPRDFSQRDTDILQVYKVMSALLPARLIRTLTRAIELHALTEKLDRDLLDVLVNKLGVTDTLTNEQYADAYRICDNYAERVRQIDMIVEVGQKVDRLVGMPFIGTTLRIARGPARRTGWHELHDFLEGGYAAFKHMRGAKEFLGTIQQREMLILDKIYARDPDPFAA